MPSVAPIHRLTVDDVRRMYEAEIIDERLRLELADGVLIEMSPTGPAHIRAVAWCNRHLSRPDGDWHLIVQDTLVIQRGYVLPDIAVARGALPSAEAATPLLVIEVAQSSQRRDAEKAADYARAGVAEYWIVDLPGRTVTVHSDPRGSRYEAVRAHVDGALLEVPVDVPPVAVSELLGPRAES